ncbi:LOW QUALITY PROTEIN: zinc finger C2HC domain-containing protein 1B [Chlamydotis macqueenii]
MGSSGCDPQHERERIAWPWLSQCSRQGGLAVLLQESELRHDPICKKIFKMKRKPFSSLKQRLGTEVTTVKKQPPLKPGKKSNWRQNHEDFINTISSKHVSKALKEGHALPPPPPPSINPGQATSDSEKNLQPQQPLCYHFRREYKKVPMQTNLGQKFG